MFVVSGDGGAKYRRRQERVLHALCQEGVFRAFLRLPGVAERETLALCVHKREYGKSTCDDTTLKTTTSRQSAHEWLIHERRYTCACTTMYVKESNSFVHIHVINMLPCLNYVIP